MSAPVFICEAVADATQGARLSLDGQEARHALTVQRRQVGEVIDLVDGRGRRASGPIVTATDGVLTIEVERVSIDADAPLTLVQALAKGGRDEQAVEAAIELGATRIVPWQAARSIVQWRGPKADKARQAWQDLARAAAKQSRRALVPTVEPAMDTRALAAMLRDAVGGGGRALVLHEEAAVGIGALDWSEPHGEVVLIVGPEGGIGAEELATLTTAGATAVRLGGYVLRSSSAGPAAIAAIAALRGAWSGGPGAPASTLEP